MGRFLRLVIYLALLAIVVVPVALVLFGLEREPLIARAAGLDLQDLKSAQTLARRFDPRRMPPQQVTVVRANANELNTLLKGALAGLPRVAGRAAVTRYGVIAAVTVETPLPANPLGRFVNLRTTVRPSRTGLEISRIAVGTLEIPPGLIRPALNLALDRLVGAGKGGPILDSVRSVRIQGTTVMVAFRPPPDLVSDLKAAAKRQVRIVDSETVRPYYEELGRVRARTRTLGRLSLVEFVRPLFGLARERSRSRDPVAENKGAILALAMVFGDARFERLAGAVRRAEEAPTAPVDHVRLDGRHDFVQHFTVSMGLALTGGRAAANVIGEIKEAMDSGKASGFSFTDIGADRAGVRFAELATGGTSAARRLQEKLASAGSERVFFPSFRDLPEGLNESAFRRRYGDVDSAAYRRVIAEIDRRIARAPLFREAGRR